MKPNNVALGTLFLAALLLPAAGHASGPGELKFDQSTFEVFEESGFALIVVERSGGEDGAVSVAYSTEGQTATPGVDFTAVSGVLSWSDRDGGNKTFSIPLLDDSEEEGEETVRLVLSAPTGGATIDPERGTSTLRILASDGGSGGGGGGGGGDDEPGLLKFDQSSFLVQESAGVVVVTVERSGGDDGAVSVEYRTSGGTATAGEDFTASVGTLSWGDSEDGSKAFSVPILDNLRHEDTESFQVQLGEPSGGATVDSLRGNALVTIYDDDPDLPGGEAGLVRFDDDSFAVFEDADLATVKVERSRGSVGAVSVDVVTRDGTAIQGLDYESVVATVSWADGEEGPRFVAVPILEDTLLEGNETAGLELVSPSDPAILDPAGDSAELLILDDDAETGACVQDDTTLCLGEGGRFKAQIVWRTKQGDIGPGSAQSLSAGSGTFWFFNPDNIEMLIKVVDGCSLPGLEGYWVFYSATTNVDFTVTVTDTLTGKVKQYLNPQGQEAAPALDTSGFTTCP